MLPLDNQIYLVIRKLNIIKLKILTRKFVSIKFPLSFFSYFQRFGNNLLSKIKLLTLRQYFLIIITDPEL